MGEMNNGERDMLHRQVICVYIETADKMWVQIVQRNPQALSLSPRGISTWQNCNSLEEIRKLK